MGVLRKLAKLFFFSLRESSAEIGKIKDSLLLEFGCISNETLFWLSALEITKIKKLK